VFVGRSADQGSWIRRSTKESLVTNGRDSPSLRNGMATASLKDIRNNKSADLKLDEKIDGSTVSLPAPETPKIGASIELIAQVSYFTLRIQYFDNFYAD
jgi:hypothetical protein